MTPSNQDSGTARLVESSDPYLCLAKLSVFTRYASVTTLYLSTFSFTPETAGLYGDLLLAPRYGLPVVGAGARAGCPVAGPLDQRR